MRADHGPARCYGSGGEAGFTLLEALVASSLSLIAAIALYQTLLAGRRLFVLESDRSEAAATGRALIEVIGSDLRQAGYAPFGPPLVAIPFGSRSALRRLADFNGDGLTTAADEDVLYAFVDPDGDGVYELLRGINQNADGQFGSGETYESVATGIAPTDADGDGLPDAFFAYDQSPPATTSVTMAFALRLGERSRRDPRSRAVPFSAMVRLRNR